MKRLSFSQVAAELALTREAYNRGDIDLALEIVDRVLKTNGDSGAVHFSRGSILLGVGRPVDALACFVECLGNEPNHGDALYWAAQISLNLRLSEDAEKFALRLARIQPKNDRAFFILSVAYSLQSRWADALDAIENSVTLKPLEPDYLVGKAQLLAKGYSLSLATQWYRKALEVRPVPQIAQELAEILLEETRAEEALSLLKRFGAELPPENRPNILLARAFTESQNFEEAKEYWEVATKFSPDRRDLVATRARSEISSGRLKVAETLLRQSLLDDPKSSTLFGILAPISKMTGEDMPMIERMEQLLTQSALDPPARRGLNYALGKAYHDLRDYGKAMSFFDEANRLRRVIFRNQPNFDREEWAANIDFQIDFFTKGRIGALERQGLESSKPLFVFGMIRSGTTLTEQILSGHTMIEAGGENTFWADHFGQVSPRQSRHFDAAKARHLGKKYLDQLSPSKITASFVSDKAPLNVLQGAALHCIFPSAKMIHLIRRPVDNLLSIWMAPMITGLKFISTREDLVFAYRHYLRLVPHLSEVLPEDRYHRVAYEQLTSEPKPTIERLLGFLNLESEPSCFTPEANPRTVRTPSVYQVRQPINTDSQAMWKKYLPWLGSFAELLEDERG